MVVYLKYVSIQRDKEGNVVTVNPTFRMVEAQDIVVSLMGRTMTVITHHAAPGGEMFSLWMPKDLEEWSDGTKYLFAVDFPNEDNDYAFPKIAKGWLKNNRRIWKERIKPILLEMLGTKEMLGEENSWEGEE